MEKFIKAGSKKLTVAIHPGGERPRKGCFEVRSGKKVLLGLYDMPRPFTKLKALDIEEEAKKILAKVA